jgi:dienelactone hydrolase
MLRRMVRCIVIALLLLPLAARAQFKGFPTEVHFPSVTVGNIPAGPEITGWIFRPPGPGPFPAIILAHTCAGYGSPVSSSSKANVWGWRMAGWGYLVLAPDSFRPRGKSEVCRKPGIVTPDMRVADIAGALDYLATRPDVIKGSIGLIGHSHGGSTAVRAVQNEYRLAVRGLKGAVAYYPGCSADRDRNVGLPLLVLIGNDDDETLADWCRRLQAAGFTRPKLADVIYYPGVGHSFDRAADDGAAADAEARTKAFFDRMLLNK